jgi:hypothetical protein
VQSIMYKKGREAVNVQQFKTMQWLKYTSNP